MILYTLLLASAVVATPSPTTSLRNALAACRHDPMITAQVAIVEQRLPLYDRTINQARVSVTPRLVTIIGQSHWMSGLTPVMEHDALRSQDSVLTLLRRHNPALIAMENIEFDTVDLQIMKRKLRDDAVNVYHVSADKAEGAFRFIVDHQAPLRYLELRPQSMVIASDDQPLHELNFYLQGLPPGNAWDPMVQARASLVAEILRTRSELGLARLLQRMKIKGLSSGVLVIGQNHLRDYPSITTRYRKLNVVYKRTTFD